MNTCQICHLRFADSETYEYRGFMFCEEHFEEGIKRVDRKRDFVMETLDKTIKSQRNGEFIHNRLKYHQGNVAPDGLPIIPIKPPMVEEEYRNGIL